MGKTKRHRDAAAYEDAGLVKKTLPPRRRGTGADQWWLVNPKSDAQRGEELPPAVLCSDAPRQQKEPANNELAKDENEVEFNQLAAQQEQPPHAADRAVNEERMGEHTDFPSMAAKAEKRSDESEDHTRNTTEEKRKVPPWPHLDSGAPSDDEPSNAFKIPKRAKQHVFAPAPVSAPTANCLPAPNHHVPHKAAPSSAQGRRGASNHEDAGRQGGQRLEEPQQPGFKGYKRAPLFADGNASCTAVEVSVMEERDAAVNPPAREDAGHVAQAARGVVIEKPKQGDNPVMRPRKEDSEDFSGLSSRHRRVLKAWRELGWDRIPLAPRPANGVPPRRSNKIPHLEMNARSVFTRLRVSASAASGAGAGGV